MEEPSGQPRTVKPEGTYGRHLSEHSLIKEIQLVNDMWVLHLPDFSISKRKYSLENLLGFY